ncbi:MAG: hypothetical protein H0T76_13770 [Nannocystis sp.]|nr:hypothetical protein [Nannocystis sp.]MBA3547547.1 hypothetical protein [Nannocystis sp.]
MMSELERAIGFTEVHVSPPRRPRYLLSRPHAVALVVLSYISVVAFISILLKALALVQRYDDDRKLDAILIFTVVMAIPFGWALATVFRRSKLPAWPF